MRWGEDFFVACALIAIAIFLVVNIIKLVCGMRNGCKKNQELVRQAPVYTITADPRGNDTTSNFPNFFWNVPPQNTGPNELVKDDKDLPSYEEVIRMEMARQVTESATQAPITIPTNTVAAETVPPVRVPV